MTGPISPLIRAALFVQDLEKSRAFYAALGLRSVYYEGELDTADAAKVLQLPEECKVRCLIVKPDGGMNQGMVGLFEVTNPRPEKVEQVTSGPRVGEVALVFYCADIDRALAQAEQYGGKRLDHPILFEMPHRSQREVCLRDPDGVLMNLVERPVGEASDTRPALTIAREANGH